MCVHSDKVMLKERFPGNKREGHVITWERALQLKGRVSTKALRGAWIWQKASVAVRGEIKLER